LEANEAERPSVVNFFRVRIIGHGLDSQLQWNYLVVTGKRNRALFLTSQPLNRRRLPSPLLNTNPRLWRRLLSQRNDMKTKTKDVPSYPGGPGGKPLGPPGKPQKPPK
jgi:hypothetical protein